MSTRVLVVDDQELVRAGFVMVVDHQPDLEVVGEAGDGAEAVELVHTLRPDVVLMDPTTGPPLSPSPTDPSNSSSIVRNPGPTTPTP